MTTRAPAVLIIEQVLVGIPFKQRDYVLNFFISNYKVHTIKTLFTSTFNLLGVLKNKIMFTSQLVNSIMNSNKNYILLDMYFKKSWPRLSTRKK